MPAKNKTERAAAYRHQPDRDAREIFIAAVNGDRCLVPPRDLPFDPNRWSLHEAIVKAVRDFADWCCGARGVARPRRRVRPEINEDVTNSLELYDLRREMLDLEDATTATDAEPLEARRARRLAAARVAQFAIESIAAAGLWRLLQQCEQCERYFFERKHGQKFCDPSGRCRRAAARDREKIAEREAFEKLKVAR